jgi:competence ComEA-like helix-hairpin-helix protein
MKKPIIWCMLALSVALAVFLGVFRFRQEGKKPPLRVEVLPPMTDGAALPETEPMLNINTATEAQLQLLPGIGPVLARRIVEYREENGPFTAVSQLTMVHGVGIALLDHLIVADPMDVSDPVGDYISLSDSRLL